VQVRNAAIVSCMLFLGIFGVSQAEEKQSPKELLFKMSAVERSLDNIRVESELWEEERPTSVDQWERTPRGLSSTAWFNGLPGSKARIDVHRQVVTWTNGKAPFAEDSFSIGFDGKYGRIAHHSTGSLGRTFKARRGEVLPDAPTMLKNRMYECGTGAAFSIFFFQNQDGKSLSDRLNKVASTPNVSFRISNEAFQDIPCTRITSERPGVVEESWWLDASRGLALLGYERVVTKGGKKEIVERSTITKLVKAGEGIWYPGEACTELIWPDGKQSRWYYKAAKVVANDPTFDENIFTVSFPPGYTIQDKTVGTTYRTGPPPEDLQNTLDEIVSEAITTKPAVSNEPDNGRAATQALLEHEGIVPTAKNYGQRMGADSSDGHRHLILVLVVILPLVIAGIILLRKHIGRPI